MRRAPDLFWKAFDALPVPVLVVDDAGTILHANGACTKLADGVEILSRPLASFFVAEDGPAIAKLIADGFAGGYEDTPVFTAPADGQTVQVVLQALSVLPGAGGQRQLAMRCELRAEAGAPEPPAPAGPDLAAEIAALQRVARRAGPDRRRDARRADAPLRGARRAARTGQRRPPRAGRAARPARDRAARPRARARAGADRGGEDRSSSSASSPSGTHGSRRRAGAGPAGGEHRGAVDAAQRARRVAAAHDQPGRRRRAHRGALRRHRNVRAPGGGGAEDRPRRRAAADARARSGPGRRRGRAGPRRRGRRGGARGDQETAQGPAATTPPRRRPPSCSGRSTSCAPRSSRSRTPARSSRSCSTRTPRTWNRRSRTTKNASKPWARASRTSVPRSRRSRARAEAPPSGRAAARPAPRVPTSPRTRRASSRPSRPCRAGSRTVPLTRHQVVSWRKPKFSRTPRPKQQQVATARIAPERHLLEHHGRQRDQRAVDAPTAGRCSSAKRQSIRPKQSAPDGQDVARDLDDRPERLEQDVVRQRQQADHAVARVAHHAAVVAEHLAEAALPAVALAPRIARRLRHLGPAHRVGQEDDAVRLLALAADAVQAHAPAPCPRRSCRARSRRRRSRPAAEDAERAGDDEQRAHRRLQPTRPARNARRYSTTWNIASQLLGQPAPR